MGIGNQNNDQQISRIGIADRHIEVQLHTVVSYLDRHTWIVTLLRTASTCIKSADLDTIFDGYTSEFEEMLNFADAIIKDHYAMVTPLLSFDMGVVPPINFVAVKCRVLRPRRKAIDALNRHQNKKVSGGVRQLSSMQSGSFKLRKRGGVPHWSRSHYLSVRG